MNYIDQYLRDLYTLLKSSAIKNKWYMFFFYQYLCFKNIIWKIFKIKFTSQKFENYTIYFDNYYAFFAIFTELFIYNIYHFETKKEKPFIVDCGGNIGLAVFYFKHLYPHAIIECYEPDRETFSILEKNIFKNKLEDVKCINEAISGEAWELEFFSFWDMKGWPGNTLEKTQVNFKNVNSYKVKVTTLSEKKYDFIDFLKMDIEGSEWKAFEDLDKTDLISKIWRINLEYHYDEWLSHNKLSDILRIFEKNNMHVILNTNTLIWNYVTEKDFVRLNSKYVMIIDAFHSDER